MRNVLVSTLLLLIGFAIGCLWSSRAPSANGQSTPARETSSQSGEPRPAGTTAAHGPAPAPPTSELVSPTEERLHAIRLLKAVGLPVKVFPILAEEPSREIIALLQLSELEIKQLTNLHRATRQAIARERMAAATSRVGDDGKIIVDAPGLAAAASAEYFDRCTRRYRELLGADRFALFNEVAGEQFERSFERFGLDALSFHFSPRLRQVTEGAPAVVEFTRYWFDASGNGTGTSSNMLPPAALLRQHPELERMLPPELLPPRG